MTKTTSTQTASTGLRERILANAAKIFPQLTKRSFSKGSRGVESDGVFKITTKVGLYQGKGSNCASVIRAILSRGSKTIIEGPPKATSQGALVGLLKVTECILAKYPKLAKAAPEGTMERIAGGGVDHKLLKQALECCQRQSKQTR